MKKLTLRKTIKLHRELWNWLADNPGEGKRDWPRWEEIEAEYGKIKNLCFACHYCGNNCLKCPFDWTMGKEYSYICEGSKGLFSLYCESQKNADRLIYDRYGTRFFALKIAYMSLKWRYKLMYIFMPWK